MQITRIAIRRGRVNAVFFDEQLPDFCPLSDDGGLLIERGICERAALKAGDNLTDEDIWQLCEASEHERARQRAMWLLDSRDYTRRGMADKLRPLFGQAAADYAADYCAEIGLIDDMRYAERRAELMAERGISARDAVRRLTAKGVPRQLAEQAVQATDAVAADQLDALIAKKYAARLATGDKKEIERVVAALARKGFEFGDIRDAVSRFADTDSIIYED